MLTRKNCFQVRKFMFRIYKKYSFRKIWFKPFYSASWESDWFKSLSQNLMIYYAKCLILVIYLLQTLLELYLLRKTSISVTNYLFNDLQNWLKKWDWLVVGRISFLLLVKDRLRLCKSASILEETLWDWEIT